MEQQLRILSVNKSAAKGEGKKPAGFIELNAMGIVGDSHAGRGPRQISLLGKESLDGLSLETGRPIAFGESSENITTEGIALNTLLPLDRLKGHQAALEVTRTGMPSHGGKGAINDKNSHCLMHREGIFARVVSPGTLRAGDVLVYRPRIWNILIVTLSDRASRGEYDDRSGPAVATLLKNHYEPGKRAININSRIIADNAAPLNNLIEEALQQHTDVLITTGGTGVGPRDITVDTVKPLLTQEITGIMEMIRVKYGANKPNALLSRSVAGFIGNMLVYTLPGSAKAVNEYMEEILKTLDHLIYMRHGLDTH